MACDIHLRLEKRLKNPMDYLTKRYDKKDIINDKIFARYYNVLKGWKTCYIHGYKGCWRVRSYEMFAYLNNVRNYDTEGIVKPLKNRGFPEDACEETLEEYTYTEWNGVGDCPEDWGRYAEKSDFERWVNDYKRKVYELKDDNGNIWKRMVVDPDAHSPNWCTTEEMEYCINQVFKNEDNTYQEDCEEWLALLGAMKGYESTGEYECRAVFWFDN